MNGRRPGGRRVARRRAEHDVDDELAFHRTCTIDELIAQGLGPDAATAEADRRFGPADTYRQGLVRLDLDDEPRFTGSRLMTLLIGSLRAVVRDIRRAPGFTLGVILILTLGLGVNAVTFGLVDRLVLRGPAGIRNPDELRLVVLRGARLASPNAETTSLGYLDLQDIRTAHQLTGAAAETGGPLLSGSGLNSEQIQGVLVTANYFPLLGVEPALGRFFTDDESSVQGARVAVLSHAYWQRAFGGDSAAIGRTLDIEGQRYAIVGVAPERFTGTAVSRVDVFLPLEAAADTQVSGPWRTRRHFTWFQVVTRLAPGATSVSAADEATAIYNRATAATEKHETRVELAPINALSGASASPDAGIAALVAVVSLAVLLVGFSNVANLFLARSLRRADQIALRLALGASRARLLLEESAEGAWLALIGATAAVAVAGVGAPAVQRLLFPSVAWVDAPVNVRVLLLVAGCAVAGGAIVASLPVWRASRAEFAGALGGGAGRVSRRRTGAQTAMLVVQTALSVLLLVGAGLFTRSLTRAHAVDLGLDADRLLVVSIDTGGRPRAPEFFDTLRARVASLPGVEATTLSSGTLPFVSSWAERLSVPSLPELPNVPDGGPYISAVEPGYFQIAGSRIVRGRAFTAADRLGAERVAVVNEIMARMFWPGQDAIGQCLLIGQGTPSCARVVGVVASAHREVIVKGESLLYFVPIEQAPDSLRRNPRLVVRATTEARALTLADPIRRQAIDLDPALRNVTARPLEDVISPQLRTWRLGAGLFGAFAALALAVAIMGLYSVVAFDVEGRRREMGLRAALGATSSAIVRLVVREAMTTTAAGLGAGLVLAWTTAPLVATWLYGVSPGDATAFLAASSALVAAAIAASLVPGLRASRVDPSKALRTS